MAAFINQKYAACILLSLMAAFSMPNSADAGYTMAETCNYLSSGYIADPTNCQNWGYCQGGALIAQGSCGTGLLYDSTTGQCNYAKDVTCTSTVENACANQPDPGYIGDPNNCNQYCYCSNGVVSECFNCPMYQVFDSSITQCVWGSSYSCPANSICRLVQNNQFVGDPSICGNYIRCLDGAGTSAACAEGKFNPLKGGCDPSYTSCINNGETPGTPSGPPIPPPTNSTICSQYVTATGGTQYFSDFITCYGYYACSSQTGAGTWGSCPFATHFNGKDCVTPYSYACPWDRCGNLNLQFVSDVGCESYSVCSNQQNVGGGKCGSSNAAFPYLDEAGGGCVATKPTQAICSATAPTFPSAT